MSCIPKFLAYRETYDGSVSTIMQWICFAFEPRGATLDKLLQRFSKSEMKHC